MKEPYGEGLANHTDLESCIVNRKVGVEALTEAGAGWVLSCETLNSGVPMLSKEQKATPGASIFGEMSLDPRSRRPHARTETLHTGTGRSQFLPRLTRP